MTHAIMYSTKQMLDHKMHKTNFTNIQIIFKFQNSSNICFVSLYKISAQRILYFKSEIHKR